MVDLQERAAGDRRRRSAAAALLLGLCLAAGASTSALAASGQGVVAPPPNDLFADAIVVPATGTSTYTEHKMESATQSLDDPDYSCRYEAPGPAYNGVWYAFTATHAAHVTISTGASIGAIEDTTLSVLTHDGVGFTEVGCSEDNGPEQAPYLSQLVVNVAANQMYYVFVSLFNELEPGATGTLVVDFSFGGPWPVVPNDLFEHATVVPASAHVSFTEPDISYATASPDDPTYSCGAENAGVGANGVWYAITPDQDTRATFSTQASSDGVADTMLAVLLHDGAQFADVACNDDTDAAAEHYLSRLTVDLAAGETYYVFVSLHDPLAPGQPGTLVLDVFLDAPPPPPAHDLFANARSIDTLPYIDIEPGMPSATRSAGDPEHACHDAAVAQTVWYSFTAPADGTVALDTLDSTGIMTDTVLSLFTGDPSAFHSVACSDDIDAGNQVYTSRIASARVSAGTVYTVYVSRYADEPSEDPGTLVLHFDFVAHVAPLIVVDSAPIEIALVAGGTHTQPLAIGNAGTADLDWRINEADIGVRAAPTIVLDEGFDNIGTLAAAGWTLVNRSSPIGPTTWFQGIAWNGSYGFDAYEGAPNAWIGSDLWSTGLFSPGTISNWLLTPQIALEDGMVFTFYTRAYQFAHPDRLEVRLSSAGASADVGANHLGVGAFTTVLARINPDLAVDGYPIEWTRVSVTLGGLAPGTTGRIGFRYFVTNAGGSAVNGDVIGIDSVHVRGPSACELGVDQGWLSVSPAAGSTVPGDESEVSVGIDTSDLAPGTYEAQLCIDSNDTLTPRIAVPVRLTVTPAPLDPLVIAPATLADGMVNVAYHASLTATSDDAIAPIDFAVTDGVLPTGLALLADGTLQGTPTAAGTHAFSVTATDSATTPLTGAIDYTLVVHDDAHVFADGFELRSVVPASPD